MLQKNSRPPSVLITQVILIMIGGIWFVAGLLSLFAAITTTPSPAQPIVFLIVGALALAASTSFLIGFWGLVKRKRYGRWIGVVGISLLLLSVLIGNIFPSTGPISSYEYTNSFEMMGSVIAAILFYGVIAFLIYRLARGTRANAFFSGEGTPVE